MRLSNLELTSTFRLTQPNTSEENQLVDIQFALDGSKANIPNEFYDLAFYQMLNGFVTGKSETGVDTGIKAVIYDNNGLAIAESAVVMLNKVMTETGTKLTAEASVAVADTTNSVYITKIDLVYVSNDSAAETEQVIFTSAAPVSCAFADDIPGTNPVVKGVEVLGGYDSLFTCMLNMS